MKSNEKPETSEKYQTKRYAKHETFKEDKYYLHKVLQLIRKKSFSSAMSLELACGDGSFSKKLVTDLGFDAYGLDMSDATKKASKKGIKVKKVNLDKSKLPYSNNKFDLVIACELIEHLYDTDFFFK